MPNPYAAGSIAGVNLEVSGEPMKAIILDGANLQSAFAINNRISASGNVYTQSIALSGGRRFGVRLDFSDIDVLKDFVATILEVIDAQEPFNVTLEDALHSIDADCEPDGSVWIQYPEQRLSSNQVKSVVLRFVTA